MAYTDVNFMRERMKDTLQSWEDAAQNSNSGSSRIIWRTQSGVFWNGLKRKRRVKPVSKRRLMHSLKMPTGDGDGSTQKL